jgi:hypothetical protein
MILSLLYAPFSPLFAFSVALRPKVVPPTSSPFRPLLFLIGSIQGQENCAVEPPRRVHYGLSICSQGRGELWVVLKE